MDSWLHLTKSITSIHSCTNWFSSDRRWCLWSMGTNCWNYRYRRRRRWWWRWRTKAGAEQKAREECDTIRLAFLFTVKYNYMDMGEIIWTRVSEYPARWDNPVTGLLCLHVLPLSCQRLPEGRKRSLEYCSTQAILVQGPDPLCEEMKRKLERTKCYLLC